MHSYIILTVLYNKDLDCSETINSLIKSKYRLEKSTLFIWDNSTTPQTLEKLANLRSQFEKTEIIYKHTPENMSLSEIYNTFLDEIFVSRDFVVLLDHDTSFDENFFLAHEKSLNNNNNINLYLPKVIFKNEIVSPCRQLFYKSLPYKTLKHGTYTSSNKTAINSGMIIRWSYFSDIFRGYDTRLKFYGTDDYFMREYRKINRFFYVLDYSIHHDLTCNPMSDDIQKFKASFHESQQAFLILHSSGRKFSVAGLVVLIRKLKHTIKFKLNFFSSKN
ncbi:glycosyltransferase [Pseudomonas sp. CF161]|uniref:glycosyltransferase n=1 Tax=Pseudomonas sp. CF161 TaxID=911241 RepID=UPI00035506C3|nr:glycosyltransferase [Pseudomonas sp. CF161]EPL08524.1 putative glycosyltransferase [Pseudomonas sp. CF161]